jgi:hypothetical protein
MKCLMNDKYFSLSKSYGDWSAWEIRDYWPGRRGDRVGGAQQLGAEEQEQEDGGLQTAVQARWPAAAAPLLGD